MANGALFLSLLVAVLAFMAAPPSVEARINPVVRILILPPREVNITGTVFCTRSVKLTANGTVPSYLQPFAKATVILRCGNTNVANAITDVSGKFSIVSESREVVLPVFSYLLGFKVKCQLIVKEPLSSCDFTLPTRRLVAEITAPFSRLNPVPRGILVPDVSYFMLPPNA